LALNHGQPLLSRPGRAAPRTAIPWIPWCHRPVGGEATWTTSERLGGCGHCARQQPGELQREEGDQGDQGGSQGLPIGLELESQRADDADEKPDLGAMKGWLQLLSLSISVPF